MGTVETPVPVHVLKLYLTCMCTYMYLNLYPYLFTCLYLQMYLQYTSVSTCTCSFSHLYVPAPVLVCTDPAREEGAVLELAQVKSDEICSRHEHKWQQGRVWFSNNLPRIPGSCGVVTSRWRCCVVSMVTVLERMLLKDLEKTQNVWLVSESAL